MDFHFLDQSKLVITNYAYNDFDTIVCNFGYKQEKNEQLHLYYDWNKIRHWGFCYESYSEIELKEAFMKTEVYKSSISFIVRLLHHLPLLEINAFNLSGMLEDLCYESGMGWEAISVCGKYIIEFTDNLEYMVKTNFEIKSPSIEF
jgi:hypothetical protein